MDPNAPAPVDPMAALDAGIAGEAMPTGEPVEAATDDPTPATTPDPVTTAEPDPLGLEEPTEPPADPAPADPNAPQADEPAPKADTPDPAAEVETEISGLGLKEKAANRFRELSAQVTEVAPLRAELEAVGVKSVDDLRGLIADADRCVAIFDEVRATGARAEDYATALELLHLRNEFRTTHNPEAAQKAFDMLAEELVNIGMVLGKDPGEIASRFDPLAGHPDLQEAVEALEITRQAAVELAQGRNLRNVASAQREAQTSTSQAQQAQVQAVNAARTALDALGQQLGQEDRARLLHYHGNGTLGQIVAQVRAQHPDRPELWADKVEVAYRRLPAIAPAPAPAPSPARAATPLPPAMALDFSKLSPEQALDAALAGL